MKRLAKWTGDSKPMFYYQGGFNAKMDRKEASLVLNVR